MFWEFDTIFHPILTVNSFSEQGVFFHKMNSVISSQFPTNYEWSDLTQMLHLKIRVTVVLWARIMKMKLEENFKCRRYKPVRFLPAGK